MRIPYRYKLSLSIGLLSVLITGGALFFFYRTIYRTVWDQMTLRLMDVAGTGISLMSQEEKDSLARFARKVQEITPADSLGSRSLEAIPAGDIAEPLGEDQVVSLESEPDFLSLVDLLNRIKDGTSRDGKRLIRYAYFLTPVPDRPGYMQFVADADFYAYDYNEDGVIGDEETAASPGTLYNASEFLELARAEKEKIITADPEFTEDNWGIMVSAYAPVLDKNGNVIALLGLDMLANNEYNLVNDLFWLYIGIVLISVLLTVSAAYLMGGLLTRPVNILRSGAERVRNRQFDTEINIKTNDELEVLGDTFNDMIREIREYSGNLQKQNQAFFRFVPTEFVQILGKDNAVEINAGESNVLRLSVLFSDIRSFTTMSEDMTPSEVLDFVNSYLEVMEPVIHEHGGFIDKYLGDGIMALFIDRDGISSANRAVNAAIAMQRQLSGFNEFRKDQGADPVLTGMGIATGDVIIGTVGTQTRLDTTVLGHSVNMASRLESLTPSYGISILITEDTFSDLSDPEQYRYREIDTVIAKGMRKPNLLYEIFDADSQDEIRIKEQGRPHLHKGILLYKLGQFQEAYNEFSQMYRLNENDRMARIYLKRCKKFLETPPPEDWQGSMRLSRKG
ncbi:MAG: hypothetical protein CMN76_02835 [Spirochaetaceae bacterium]|nr:hypothetical protein [Spirochaetaceae bacterium]